MKSETVFRSEVLAKMTLGTLMLLMAAQFVAGATLNQVDDAYKLYYVGICPCVHGETVYGTQFRFMNEVETFREGSGAPIRATLAFFQSDGSPMEVVTTQDWVGPVGTLERVGNEVNFSIPSQSTLVLRLVPQEGANLGWARLVSEGPLHPQASLQVAKVETKAEGSAFEEGLLYEAELFPTVASKQFVLPVSLFAGMKRLSTAFTVANLSGVSSKVQLTLRPDNTREVILGPGELLADYFQHFWTIAFPAIFPLDYRGTIEIKSEAPLSLGAFRTTNGYPNLGVRPAIAFASQTPDFEPSLDTPFELSAGQVAKVQGVQIEFWSVAEDSRCPTDVQCVWEGRVKIDLRLSGSNERETVQLSPVAGEDTAEYDGLQIQLLEVTPAPVSTQTLEISDYRIRLVVSEK